MQCRRPVQSLSTPTRLSLTIGIFHACTRSSCCRRVLPASVWCGAFYTADRPTEPVGAGSAGSPLPALKNLLHRETLRRFSDELGDGLRLRNVDRMATFHLDDA